jgi:biopolymer transport protein ExbD
MSFGGFEKQNNAPMSEINTTPLVDVMLVLLIIFIVTAPLITNNVSVNLPKTKSTASPQKPTIVKVGLNEKGQMFWNGTEISKDDLATLFSDTAKDKPDTELQLEADKNSRYQEITEIMVEAQKAGITKLGFISRAEK